MNIFHVTTSSRRCYLFYCNWNSLFRKNQFFKGKILSNRVNIWQFSYFLGRLHGSKCFKIKECQSTQNIGSLSLHLGIVMYRTIFWHYMKFGCMYIITFKKKVILSKIKPFYFCIFLRFLHPFFCNLSASK